MMWRQLGSALGSRKDLDDGIHLYILSTLVLLSRRCETSQLSLDHSIDNLFFVVLAGLPCKSTY